jgi:hypothetical protein
MLGLFCERLAFVRTGLTAVCVCACSSQSAPVLPSDTAETSYGEWVVMDYNEDDYIIKPFHVDTVSLNMGHIGPVTIFST